ncbi:hypothetical protein BDQ17DRAFT_1380166 [Cyathus striatus]|nr:hypothetical protein BDQ17DRAFT_1380166 [Cyathus striatus]
MAEETKVTYYDNQLFMWNLSRKTRVSQISTGAQDRPQLDSFLIALDWLVKRGIIITQATYTPESANIFIHTDDNEWDNVPC